jgi:hypothetical protein
MIDIKRFMDENGRVKTWPAKKDTKYEILKYLSAKFENGRFYTEKEVNSVINEWHTFQDYFLIRRGLIDSWLLSRTRNGSRYWKEEREDCKDIIAFIENNYDTGNISSIFRLSTGCGSQSYYILSDTGEYIFKNMEENAINHPENESSILTEQASNGISASKIILTKSGDSVLKAEGKMYHLQKYI